MPNYFSKMNLQHRAFAAIGFLLESKRNKLMTHFRSLVEISELPTRFLNVYFCMKPSFGSPSNNGMDNQDALLNPFGQSVDSSHQQLAECLLESVHNLHLPSLLANVSQSPFSDILGQGIESLTNSFSITPSEGTD